MGSRPPTGGNGPSSIRPRSAGSRESQRRKSRPRTASSNKSQTEGTTTPTPVGRGGFALRDVSTVLDTEGAAAEKSVNILLKKTMQFSFERDGSAATYHLQGDHRFDEQDQVRKRRALFKDPKIQQQLDSVWRLSSYKDYDANPGTITKRQYMDVHIKVSKALRADWQASTAIDIAEHDWQCDIEKYLQRSPSPVPIDSTTSTPTPAISTKKKHRRQHSLSTGEEVMEKECFLWSMFEIADHWTGSVDADEYAQFLRRLFRRITAISNSVVWEYQMETAGELAAAAFASKGWSKQLLCDV